MQSWVYKALQVLHKPSIGRYTKLEEPKARESLLTPTLRKSLSKSSLVGSSSFATKTSSTLTVDTSLEPPKSALNVPDSGNLSAMPMLQAVNAAASMERTPFAIDDAKDGDEEDGDLEEADDDQVMNEVGGP